MTLLRAVVAERVSDGTAALMRKGRGSGSGMWARMLGFGKSRRGAGGVVEADDEGRGFDLVENTGIAWVGRNEGRTSGGPGVAIARCESANGRGLRGGMVDVVELGFELLGVELSAIDVGGHFEELVL